MINQYRLVTEIHEKESVMKSVQVSDRNTRERISDESVQVSVCYRENNKQYQGGVRQFSDRSLDASDDSIVIS